MKALSFTAAVLSWLLVSYGAWLAWAPAGWIALGSFLWVDLYLGNRIRRARR